MENETNNSQSPGFAFIAWLEKKFPKLIDWLLKLGDPDLNRRFRELTSAENKQHNIESDRILNIGILGAMFAILICIAQTSEKPLCLILCSWVLAYGIPLASVSVFLGEIITQAKIKNSLLILSKASQFLTYSVMISFLLSMVLFFWSISPVASILFMMSLPVAVVTAVYYMIVLVVPLESSTKK